jgi:membrane protease subunit (stomatin/prohibitin family)
MMLKEIIAVYFGTHTKPINTFCEKNAELLIVKAGGTYSFSMF